MGLSLSKNIPDDYILEEIIVLTEPVKDTFHGLRHPFENAFASLTFPLSRPYVSPLGLAALTRE
jgi:hypothetical protein